MNSLTSALTMSNPVFVTYMIAAALGVIKIMGQGWMTVYRMMKTDSGMVSPEDVRKGWTNKNPRPEQLDVNDYVDRSRRMHRNDLENIPAFLAVGLLFVITGPSLLMTQIVMYGFVAARTAHAIAYGTKQSHEIRATFYTIGSLLVIFMGVWVLIKAFGAL
ncbi:MAG: MAPEG family protein [Alphaproteobacteria bacterium]|nr:MAG: MAPEG family protein [Alphaproteobacteria bacterium]